MGATRAVAFALAADGRVEVLQKTELR